MVLNSDMKAYRNYVQKLIESDIYKIEFSYPVVILYKQYKYPWCIPCINKCIENKAI